MIKISSYNINGVRAAHRKGFVDWVEQSNPDIICIQELRADETQIPPEIGELKYHQHIFSAEKKDTPGLQSSVKTKCLKLNTGWALNGLMEKDV